MKKTVEQTHDAVELHVASPSVLRPTIVGYVLQSLRERLHYLLVYSPRDARAPKGAVDGNHTIEVSALTLL